MVDTLLVTSPVDEEHQQVLLTYVGSPKPLLYLIMTYRNPESLDSDATSFTLDNGRPCTSIPITFFVELLHALLKIEPCRYWQLAYILTRAFEGRSCSVYSEL